MLSLVVFYKFHTTVAEGRLVFSIIFEIEAPPLAMPTIIAHSAPFSSFLSSSSHFFGYLSYIIHAVATKSDSAQTM